MTPLKLNLMSDLESHSAPDAINQEEESNGWEGRFTPAQASISSALMSSLRM
jgi:hypothetical protein